jgi:hypothetical protein
VLEARAATLRAAVRARTREWHATKLAYDAVWAANRELAAFLLLPFSWCCDCGQRFRRAVGRQVRCAACLGWYETTVHCRQCGRSFTTLFKGTSRTRSRCDTCRGGAPEVSHGQA